MRRLPPSLLAPCLALALVATGCGGALPSDAHEPSARSILGPSGDVHRCMRLGTGATSPYRQPLPGAETDPALTPWLAPIPPEVRRTVLAAGLEPSLARLLRDRRSSLDLAWLARRQALSTHVQSLQTQLDALVFEAECTGDLVEGLRSAFANADSADELRWSLMSIIAGAAGAIAAGTWELADPDSPIPPAVGLGGGAAAGALGVIALVRPSRAVYLAQERNLLVPIVRGEDPDHLYPTFVFRMLTLPTRTGHTPRQELLEQFEEATAGMSADDKALLYGNGGLYDPRTLRARADMLDEIETAVAALSRDLELLQRYLGRLLDEHWLIDAPRAPQAPQAPRAPRTPRPPQAPRAPRDAPAADGGAAP